MHIDNNRKALRLFDIFIFIIWQLHYYVFNYLLPQMLSLIYKLLLLFRIVHMFINVHREDVYLLFGSVLLSRSELSREKMKFQQQIYELATSLHRESSSTTEGRESWPSLAWKSFERRVYRSSQSSKVQAKTWTVPEEDNMSGSPNIGMFNAPLNE